MTGALGRHGASVLAGAGLSDPPPQNPPATGLRSPGACRCGARSTEAPAGFACVAVSFYYLSTFSADVGLHDVSWTPFANGLGIGPIWVPLAVIFSETLPPPLPESRDRTRETGIAIGAAATIPPIAPLRTAGPTRRRRRAAA